MEVDRLAVDLRPRTPWEALDLGAAMLRVWWTPIMRVWLAVFLPWLGVNLVIAADYPWAAFILLWWTKPVFDRVVLHVASRAVFGDVPSLRDTLAHWREILTPGLARSLLWGRLAPTRSFTLPVYQLERQRGADARSRSAVLGRRASGTAFWLTVTCAHFEAAVWLSLGVLAALLTPLAPDDASGFASLFDDDSDTMLTFLDVLAYGFVITAIEPLYVVSGLALYLNRRTQLEGWDIDLAFRRMQTRLARRTGSAIVAIAACALALAAALPAPAFAQERDPQTAVKEVLAAPEFGEIKKERFWRAKKADERNAPDERLKWLAAIGNFLGELARIVAWIAAGALVVLLVLLARKYLRPPQAKSAARAGPRPDTLFGLDVRAEALPDNLAARARELAGAGRIREALSLLYRGALVSLMDAHAVRLPEGATEGDALAAGRSALPVSGAAYFVDLVAAWQTTAYGHRPASAEAASTLASQWSEHFAQTRRANA